MTASAALRADPNTLRPFRVFRFGRVGMTLCDTAVTIEGARIAAAKCRAHHPGQRVECWRCDREPTLEFAIP